MNEWGEELRTLYKLHYASSVWEYISASFLPSISVVTANSPERMSGSVEDTAERIYWLLTECGDETVTLAPKRQLAEKSLQEAEDQPDFFASLAMICTSSDEQAPPRTRLLAAMVAKNAMARSWRPKYRESPVTEEERSYVREALLSSITEHHAIIARQIAIWIARIARIDYPTHWPSLMTTLIQTLSAPSSPESPNATLHALNAAYELFTALASRRLTVHRKSFYAAAPPAFDVIRSLFSVHIGVLVNATNTDVANRAREISILSMKCLRVLLMYGYPRVDDVQAIHGLFGDLLSHPQLFMLGAENASEVQKELSLLAAKIVARTFETHPTDFHIFLPQFLQVYCDMLIKYNHSSAVDSICAQAAHFIKCALTCPAFNYSSSSNADYRTNGPVSSDDHRTRARNIVLAFFSDARVDALIESMLTRVFVLKEIETANWKDDPESFRHEDESTDWSTHTLRTSCDEIFKTLLIRDKRRIVPKVIALAESVPLSKPLLRDACYRAVGNAVYDLEGLFDFEPWLQGQLGPILQASVDDGIGSRVLQSRSAWLVGQFVAQLSRDSRRVVYGLLVNLMGKPDGDRVVALSSAGALYSLAEDLGFVGQDFVLHLRPCLESCFKLILSSETLETKKSLLTLASQLVIKSPRNSIVELLPTFNEALPLVWASDKRTHGGYAQTMGENGDMHDGESNMLKTALVVFLCSLVHKAGKWVIKNENMKRFIHDVVMYGTNLEPGGGGVYLCEDACLLWRLLIASSEEYTQKLSEMFHRIPLILKDDPNQFKEIVSVLESYALIGKETFLQMHGNVLLGILQDLLLNSRDRGCLAVTEVVDLLLQLFPNHAVQFLTPILQHMFEYCINPAVSISSVLSASYVALIARAAVSNVDGMENSILQNSPTKVEALFQSFLGRLDIIHRREKRNLVVIALCFLSARYKSSGEIRRIVPQVLNAAVQVLAAAQDKQSVTFSVGDFQHSIAKHGENQKAEDGEENEEELPEDERRKLVVSRDPGKCTKVGDAVTGMMNAIREIEDGGESYYQNIMNETGADILKQLERFMQKEVKAG